MIPYFGVDRNVVCEGGGRIALNDSVYTSYNSPLKSHFRTYTDSSNTITKGVGDTFFPIGKGKYKINFYADNTYGCL